MVDPQFLPLTLTSPNSTADGEFGYSVAASGSIVAAGAPLESVYLGGVFDYGQVHLQNTATGATAVLRGPSTAAAHFGAALAMSATRIVVGAPDFDDSAGAAYVYDYTAAVVANQSVLQTKLVATLLSPDASTNPAGHFGTSVGISGDQVVVGAPDENATGVTSAGHAYLFNLNTGSVRMLSSPSPQVDGGFGYAVAISGNRAVVGAPYESGTTTDVGFVYVYAVPTGDLLTTLLSPSPALGGSFGFAVAINGTTVVVGQPLTTFGSVFTYNLVADTNASFASPNPATNGYFGLSVAVDSSTMLVGAPGETSGGSPQAGDAYLYSTADGGLITSTFVPPDWPSGGEFGIAVAENGTTGVLVGAPYEHAGGYAGGGHAYFFTQIPVTIASPNPLLPSAAAGGLFGSSVSLDSGVAVIGAPNETGPLDNLRAGNAYLVHLPVGPITELFPEYVMPGAAFGTSVALWGGLAVVGAPNETVGGADGAVYVYNSTTGLRLARLVSPHPATSGQFGQSVATNGTAVVVGAPGENGGAGYAYVFSENQTKWSSVLLNTTHPSRHQAKGTGEFGWSVAINGSAVVVGAPGENSSRGDVARAGNVYVFDAGNGSLALNMTSPNPQTANDTHFKLGFGRSVAIATGTVVVGSPNETYLGQSMAGRAYVFSATNGSLLRSLTSSTPEAGGLFGWAVAVNGGIVGVGAIGETAFGVVDAGNIYLFNPGNPAVIDRYNSPAPWFESYFGSSIAIGHGGIILVGEPGWPNYTFSANTAGLGYEFFL